MASFRVDIIIISLETRILGTERFGAMVAGHFLLPFATDTESCIHECRRVGTLGSVWLKQT